MYILSFIVSSFSNKSNCSNKTKLVMSIAIFSLHNSFISPANNLYLLFVNKSVNVNSNICDMELE